MPTEHMQQEMEAPLLTVPSTRLEKVLNKLGESLPPGTAFEVQLPGRPAMKIGSGSVAFQLITRNELAEAALKSLDVMRIGEAYIFGDLDIEGDFLAALDLRNNFRDPHPLYAFWSLYGQKWIFGQTKRDKVWIREHYDADEDFYLLFLDSRFRCYSHGYFASDDEDLSSATERKMNTVYDSCGMQPGWRVLDIGGGWGSFAQYAGERGVHVTSLTISEESEKFCRKVIQERNLPCQVFLEHFLEYRSERPFDAIVNLGVTEHLPDYAASMKQYERLLKPGGRVYADASASDTKHPCTSFVLKHIWPGNGQPMHLPSYMDAVAASSFEVCMVRNDRHNYVLTVRKWAEALDRNRSTIVGRWGELLYRRFRIYLWGTLHGLLSRDVTAYRWMLELPASAGR